jgi:hypothetical protein
MALTRHQLCIPMSLSTSEIVSKQALEGLTKSSKTLLGPLPASQGS